jgi:hypothetical protein
MLLENLTLNRLILHEVFRRTDERQIVQPRYGSELVTLPPDAIEAFRDRVVDAFGSPSQSLELDIVATDAESTMGISKALLDATDGEFIALSKKLADKLTQVQASRSVPGGILLVFDGTANHPAQRIVGIIKAETHTGFSSLVDHGRLGIRFLRELFLTPQAKLYKIGLFLRALERPHGAARRRASWGAFVYDHLMVAADRTGAAQYFYEAFLGCALKLDSAHQTRRFYDLTREFILSSQLPQDDKMDLQTGLYNYLKVDVSPVVEARAFGTQFFGEAELRDQYLSFMARKHFPDTAVSKDLANLGAALRRRKVVFKSHIQLIGPAERFRELVDIRAIDGEPQPDGQVPQWTRIIVRDQVENPG